MGALNKYMLLRQVRKNQWLAPEELKKLQDKKLRAIVRHAYHNTEFYHRKLREAGVRPEDIKTAEDLKKIPFTTKEEVRDNSTTTMVARGVDLKKCKVVQTSGSTGIPVKAVYDEAADDWSKAVNLRSMMENGLRMRDRFVNIGISHSSNDAWFQKMGFFRMVNIGRLDNPEAQIKELQKINPEAILGYASQLNLIAHLIKENGIKGINPRTVFTTAEVLEPQMRHTIDSVFGLKLCDLYGCIELNRTAWECSEHAGYHLDVDSVITEFIGSDGEAVSSGEQGQVVYTGLYNYAMPLIRYKVGDLGVPIEEKCPCGRSLPMMKSIIGRDNDYLTLPDGQKTNCIILTSNIRRIPGILEYQAVQEKPNLIVVNIVVSKEYNKSEMEKIRQEIMALLGNQIDLEFVETGQIDRSRGGKIRAFISKIN